MMKSEKINVYVATLAVWNVKLHNIHWNVEGHLFKGIHEYTESLYDRAAEQYDETAEILKMRGEMPVATVTESLQASVIEELPSRVFSCCEAVAVVQADMEKVAKLAREIRDEAAEADDFLVQGTFEGYLAGFAKDLWFLRAMRSDAHAGEACDAKAEEKTAGAKRCCRKKA